ncbi:hypothetical protein CDAR_192341 [Caerostris darwini]|uniref:Uncharacterized protein n=1 Tax=Caerostris darwini TaxID=1538125 RepID=A0AAV4X322_9ARAC|nr:hypothetical protein CDAR_192341 [Caerostris darwini]
MKSRPPNLMINRSGGLSFHNARLKSQSAKCGSGTTRRRLGLDEECKALSHRELSPKSCGINCSLGNSRLTVHFAREFRNSIPDGSCTAAPLGSKLFTLLWHLL